jgi:hypothetical protein
MDAEELELEFLSGRIFDDALPKEQVWLHKYFPSPRERAFVTYFLTFHNYNQFVNHTGHYFCRKALYSLRVKLQALLDVHHQAKSQMDLEKLVEIETGHYHWS